MTALRTLTLLCSILFAMSATQAAGKGGNSGDGDSDDNFLPCPDQAILDMDTEFGYGTSELTKCTQVRSGLKTVVAWNLPSVNGRTGLAQQVQVTRNTVNNWENMYDMEIGSDFEVVTVGYAGGGRWLLTDEAYNRTYGVTTGNPTRALTESLIARGLHVYMCQNTMRGNSWTTPDLIPGVRMVPSGAVALIDYQNQGYKYLHP